MKNRSLLALLIFLTLSLGKTVKADDLCQLEVDWPRFLARHDLVWDRLPTRWEEAPYLGNGNLGTMLYWDEKREAFRLQVFRVDVQDHRDNTHGWSAYSRPRLMIGSFYLNFKEKVTGCNWRLHLYDAALRGTITTEAGDVEIEHYVHAEKMLIETFLTGVNSGSFQSCHWTWEPAKAETTRPGYPRTEEQVEAFAERYGDHYRQTLKLFEPNPPVEVTPIQHPEADTHTLEGLSVQNLLAGGQYAVAWERTPSGNHQERHVVSIEKTFPETTAADRAKGNVEEATRRSYHQVPKEHLDWWHEFYPASFVSIPDTRLESFYWQQMYKMACATRSDRPMMDTAGPWIQPTPWPYITWDLNVQLCYWPTYASNRLHLAESLINTLHRNKQNLINNVRPKEWQKDSVYIPVASAQDLIAPRDADKRYWPCTGNLTWAMHNCWLHYRYSMDDELLREKVYPLLRRAVNFQRHLLEEGEDGKLHLQPTFSPEYRGTSPDCNYDLALLRWGCQALLQAADRLEIDDSLIPQWKDIVQRLADYPVDNNGFMIGRDKPFSRSHRHYSHLLMAYPLYLVNIEQPEQRQLIEKSLKHWTGFEKALRGYSYTGASSISAAIGNGNDALEYLKGLERFLQPNGLYKESGPVMETPLSAAQSMHDMLLQSWGERIRVFPAVPDAWSDIAFHDLRAEGAFLVSAARSQGKTAFVRVKSLVGEPCQIQPNLNGKVQVSGERNFMVKEIESGVFSIDLRQGEEVLLWSGTERPRPTISALPADPALVNSFGLPAKDGP